MVTAVRVHQWAAAVCVLRDQAAIKRQVHFVSRNSSSKTIKINLNCLEIIICQFCILDVLAVSSSTRPRFRPAMTSFQTISRKQIPRSTSTSWSSWSSWSSGQPMKMQPVQAKPQRITTKFTNSRQVRNSKKNNLHGQNFCMQINLLHVRFIYFLALIKTLQFPEYNFCLTWSIGQSRRELSTRQWMYNLGRTSISWTIIW